MNTAEFDTRLRHQQDVAGVETPPPAPSGIPITVLSTDAELCEAIRVAAAPQHAVFVAATMEEASELGAAGRCGILVTDQALNQQNLVRMSRQMRTHDPATITIAVGSRGDDHALIGLLSSAVVERFMLKPVTPALARLVLRSASSEYQSLRSRKRRQAAAEAEVVEEAAASEPTKIAARVIPLARPESLPELSAPPPSAPEKQTQLAAPAVVIEPAPAIDAGYATTLPKSLIPWIAAAVAALVVGGAVWWTMQQRMPQIDPRQVIASNLDAAARAFAAGHYADPPESSALHHYGTVLALDPSNAAARQGVSQVADRMIESVKLGIVDGRLAEAGIALERVRRIDPNNRRLPLLQDQLRKAQENQLALLRARETAPVPVVAAAAPKPVRAAPVAKRAPATEPPPVKPAPVEATPQAQAARSIDPDDPLALGPPAPVRVQAPAATPQAAGTVAAAAATVAAVQPVEKKEASGSAVPAPVVADLRLVKVIEPEYPEEARMRNLEGWVDMVLAVDAAGVVTDARVEGGKNGRMFDRPALVAVRKWRYEPRTLPDPTATQPVRVRVHFKLEE